VKGTIAILGCLIAAYAGPLFANEVPLILEETIQLPEATARWDVAPTWGGTYIWMTVQNDTQFIYLTWETSEADSVHLTSIDMLASEYNTRFEGIEDYQLLISNGSPCALLNSRVWWQLELYGGVAVGPRVISLLDGRRVTSCSWSFGAHGNPPHWWYDWGHHSRSLESIGMPPDDFTYPVSQVDYTTGETIPSSSRYGFAGSPPNSCNEVLTSGYERASASAWANVNLIGYVSWIHHDSLRTVGHGTWTEGQLNFTVFAVSKEEWPTLIEFHEMYSVAQEVPVATMLSEDGVLLLCYPYESAPRFEITGGYVSVLPAYVLIGEASEQALGLRTNGQFDIIRIEDGQIWGQTSPLDSGYAEMKIIGRYHNETRRLVVRYESELRIYRFGEPIITDADDARPELPSDLTLSVYPNPFNPTTMIAFDLPKAARAKLVVFDLNGRLVQSLFDEQMSAGHHEVGFDGAALPSGIYFARLSAGELVRTQKMVLLK